MFYLMPNLPIVPNFLVQDPEKNKLGETGLWLTAAQKRKKEAAEAEV